MAPSPTTCLPRGAFQVFAARHGLPPLTEADRAKLDGKTNTEIMPVLFGRELSRQEIRAFAEEKETLYRELSRGRLHPLLGLLTLLDALDAAGIPAAVATSAPEVNVTEARHTLAELQKGVENFQPQAALQALAHKVVAADPEFAMGHYYLSAVTPPPDDQKHLQKAVELSARASDGERRFIETMVVARGARPADAAPALDKLAADFPDERVIQMLRGQLLTGGGRLEEALAAFDKALAIDDGTARAHALAANLRMLEGDYFAARKGFFVVPAVHLIDTALGLGRRGITMWVEPDPARFSSDNNAAPCDRSS